MIAESLKARKLPEILTLNNGEIVNSKESWRKRRDEIIELLRKEIYGFSQDEPQKVTYALRTERISLYDDNRHELYEIRMGGLNKVD